MNHPLTQPCLMCGRDHGNLPCDAPNPNHPAHLARMTGAEGWIDESDTELSHTAARAIMRFWRAVQIMLLVLGLVTAATIVIAFLT